MKKVLGYLPLFACALAVLAMMGLVLPMAEIMTESYKGWDIVFGASETVTVRGEALDVKACDFSVLNLAPYILLVLGIACALTVYKAGRANNAAWSGALCFFAASLFFFYSPNFVRLNQEIEKAFKGLGVLKLDVELASGAILAILSAIVAGICLLVANYTNKSKITMLK